MLSDYLGDAGSCCFCGAGALGHGVNTKYDSPRIAQMGGASEKELQSDLPLFSHRQAFFNVESIHSLHITSWPLRTGYT